MIALLLAITAGGVYVGSAIVARHRAQAADLAALAAAAQLATGADAACRQASTIARAMHSGLTQCVVDELDVVVTVEARAGLVAWGLGPARAAARAGPADAVG